MRILQGQVTNDSMANEELKLRKAVAWKMTVSSAREESYWSFSACTLPQSLVQFFKD